jgi:peptidoglycan-N-acetylglucosamine deacetylase
MKNIKKHINNFIKYCLPKRIFTTITSYQDKKIALTFDDGPHPENTEKILKTLKDNGVKATFFLIGEQISKYPNLARKIFEEGHEIGNHSFTHKYLNDIAFTEYVKEIEKTDKLIFNLSNKKCKIFRPPYGACNLRLILYAIKNKITIVSWSFDSNDSFAASATDLMNYIDKASIKSGDIILFHDDNKYTAQTLDFIIKNLKLKGFDFCKIGRFN